MTTNSISRRRFAHLLAAGAATTLIRPRVAISAEPGVSPTQTSTTAAGVVRLSSNENPYGPSAKAIERIQSSFDLACRYPDDDADRLVESLARLNGVAPDQILLGAGSGEILKLAAVAFTGPAGNARKGEGRGTLVAADPTFEAILHHAGFGGAEVVKVPLTSTYAHDLKKMGTAAKDGLVYICNPNNPTASLTPKTELREFIAKTPRSTMILVDEAYHHYVDSPDYETVIPFVKDHPNLLVARTFSKIYGMAGMRCGYSVAQKETIDRMRGHQSSDTVNIMALVAARASLDDEAQVANGRKLNAEARAFVTRELETMGYNSIIPSQANFIMFDIRRPVVPVIAALKQRNVQVGRLFPALPNHMRLTIGKQAEMEAFLRAFREVIA